MFRCTVVMVVFAFCSPGLRCQPGPASAKTHDIFEFHSGFWVNLHQFLYAQATATDPDTSKSPAWQEALAYYRREMLSHNLGDKDMAAINDRLSHAEAARSLQGSGLDPKLRSVLERAAAVYRDAWWPEHNRANRAWIEAVKPLLARYGAAMTSEIAGAFRVAWPDSVIRTDVSQSAGPVGAYTTREPTHITVSSADLGYRGRASLEMLFHEASHTLNDKVDDALSEELHSQGKLFVRRGFGHAVLFYTVGEIARRHLGEYQPYGFLHGMYDDRGWPDSLPVLEKDWKPYLDGKREFSEAVRSMVRDYSIPKQSVELALRMRFE